MSAPHKSIVIFLLLFYARFMTLHFFPFPKLPRNRRMVLIFDTSTATWYIDRMAHNILQIFQLTCIEYINSQIIIYWVIEMITLYVSCAVLHSFISTLLPFYSTLNLVSILVQSPMNGDIVAVACARANILNWDDDVDDNRI